MFGFPSDMSSELVKYTVFEVLLWAGIPAGSAYCATSALPGDADTP